MSTGQAEYGAAPGEIQAKARTVFVTGGSRGIGAACVAWFLARGDRVATTYRGDTTPEYLAKYDPDTCLPIACDVTEPDQIDAAYSEIEDLFGPVEVLVSNAGITRDTLAIRMNDQAWDAVIDTNLTGSFRVAKRALPKMLRAHSGRIIFISSIGAFVGLPGQANYAASKAGLVGMARSLAREVASRQITVNLVAPGVVDTDMTNDLGEARINELTAMVPIGRAATPNDVAEAVGFLASSAASYITGSLIPVDGGLGMGL
ncbi:MAG: 3-oxoacyl-ACP reductase FabG [Acidimicrobiales bacterium]|nr:3-oxoacyl-ACP reductase FabG [Actinomycetota bacterium]